MNKKYNLFLAENSRFWFLKLHIFNENRRNRWFILKIANFANFWGSKSPIFGDWRSIARAKFLSPDVGPKSRIWRYIAKNGNTDTGISCRIDPVGKMLSALSSCHSRILNPRYVLFFDSWSKQDAIFVYWSRNLSDLCNKIRNMSWSNLICLWN